MTPSSIGRVLVIGSINMDIVATVDRLPVHGETITTNQLQHFPGGKGANQAVAAVRAGAESKLVGSVGDDSYADELIQFLQRNNVDTTDIDRFGGLSGTAIITVESSGENTIVIAEGANKYVTPASLKLLELHPSDVVLLQNEIPHKTNIDAAKRAREAGATVIYNPAPWRNESVELAKYVNVLIVNEVEFMQFVTLGKADSQSSRIQDHLAQIKTPENIIVTMGDKGAIARFDGSVVNISAIPANTKDSTGAGDAFSGAFAACTATGAGIASSLVFATTAAGISVERIGAGPSMPMLKEIESRIPQ